MTGSARIVRGNALALPLDDSTVDLIVTSPPYFGLRSYQDGGEHYGGQIGSEATPAEFVDALIAATREMVRVLKPSGSIWVNLGDKYAGAGRGNNRSTALNNTDGMMTARLQSSNGRQHLGLETAPAKSLMGIPWRYAIRCIDDLGLILRAEVIWSKPNGLPESVTDRVRRSHETWFHFTKEPRYFSAVDEIREAHTTAGRTSGKGSGQHLGSVMLAPQTQRDDQQYNPLGKLPGSVWTIATQPLTVPAHLGVDHFAAFPMEWPRRIIRGWSPAGVCTACGEGRRPVIDRETPADLGPRIDGRNRQRQGQGPPGNGLDVQPTYLTGYACACPDTTGPTTPAVVLDPFGGTGTTALVAKVLGRHGISVDMSSDYCRLAQWRTSDPKQLAKAARREYVAPREQAEGQLDLLEGIA